MSISAFLYYKTKNEFPIYLNILLFSFRFLVLFSIGILLLNPYFFRNTKVLQKPVLVVAIDESESMLNGSDSISIAQNIQSKIDIFEKELSDIYELDFIAFHQDIEEHPSLSFNGKRTDLGKLLSYTFDKYYMLPITGLVLLSDGHYNQGITPLQFSKNQTMSIFPLVYGDTSIQSDVLIDAIFHNKLVKQETPFPVDVNIQAQGLQGEKLHIRIEKGGRLLQEKELYITSQNFYKELRFEVKASGQGLQAYRVRISQLEGEQNYKNNQSDFYVEVLESGNKILILGHSPHPDLGALASALRKVDGFEVDVRTLSDYPFKTNEYQLIILHGLPSLDERSKAIFSQQDLKNKALWYIWSSSTDFAELSKNDFPWDINNSISGFEYAELSANSDFSNFKMPNNWVQTYETYPPLYVPFVKLQSRQKTDLMFSQRIRGFESGEVLLGLWSKAALKRAYLAGEGLWKWRIYSYKSTNNHEEFNTLVNRTAQYLLTGVYDDRFALQYQSVYNETDLIEWEAQVYNQAFETTTDAEVSALITDQSGAEYPYQFSAEENGFHAELGYLQAGEYSFKATAQLIDTLLQDEGRFVVEAWDLEQSRTGSDWKLLNQLAEQSGAKAYTETQLEQLIEELKVRPDAATRYSYIQKIINFIDLKWLAFLLIMILSAEWIIRKRFGSY